MRIEGCYLKREGASHSFWLNPKNGSIEAVPRHNNEIKEPLAKKILTESFWRQDCRSYAGSRRGYLEFVLKGDERIPDQANFVASVLEAALEKLDRKSMIRAKGCDFDWLLDRVTGLFGLTTKQV